MTYLPVPDSTDMALQRQSVDLLGISQHRTVKNVGTFPAPATKTVVNDASVLMAVGSANAEGRRSLLIRNDGDGVALISGANSGGGERLLPSQSILFEFGEDGSGAYQDVSVYARAETIATDLFIREM